MGGEWLENQLLQGQESKEGRVSKMTSGCMRGITRWKKVSFTELENPRICSVRGHRGQVGKRHGSD